MHRGIVVVQSLSPDWLFTTHELLHTRFPCPSLSPRVGSNTCPLSQWCHPTISSSAIPFSSCFQSFPAQGLFQVSSSHQVTKVSELQVQHQCFQWIFRVDFPRIDGFDLQWVGSSHQVAKVLEFQLQHQSFQWIFRTDFLWDGLVGSLCCSRDSQDSSQFERINSLTFSLLYGPALISLHGYWKNHSFD